MNRRAAFLALAGLVAATILALVAPLPVLLLACVTGALVMRHRRAFLIFLLVSVAFNVAILAYVDREHGWMRGLTGALRMGSALAMNLAILTRVGGPQLLEGVRPPARVTAFLAAILLAAEDVGRDLTRLRDARRLEGDWPEGRLARARSMSGILPALLVAALRRATTRREALLLAGHPFAPWFVPVVAVAALVAAGRLAFLALPNIAFTYVIAFLAGLLFGPRVGAAGAFVGMALTDLLLTGFYPGGFVNAPAMALLALLGASLRSVRLDAPLCGAIGIMSTFLFSAASDSLTWVLVYSGEPRAWWPIVLAGLVFNVIPALVNGAIFAASVTPSVRAYRAWQAQAPRAPKSTGEASRAAAAPPG